MGIKDEFEINIPSDTSEGQKVQLRIIELLKENDFTDRDLFGMRLALEEALVNAIKHGNNLADDKEVNVVCEVHDTHVKVVITDQGDGFKLQDIPDPTEEENLEKPCGRGIMLMKAYMTSIEYNDVGNSVTFIKNRTIEE
jgi:serine/threonine-protein kinase RsbW